jgi:hypothetical protein
MTFSSRTRAGARLALFRRFSQLNMFARARPSPRESAAEALGPFAMPISAGNAAS